MTPTRNRRNGNGNPFPSHRNDFFNDFFSPAFFDFETGFPNGGLKIPPANITETKNDFRLELSAPGLKREDFKVEIENGALIISCEKEEEKKDESEDRKRVEFSYNSFSRSFMLPDNVKEDGINAKYEDGMLKVSVPKKEPGMARSKKEISVA